MTFIPHVADVFFLHIQKLFAPKATMSDACLLAFDPVCVELLLRRCGEILRSSTGQVLDDATWRMFCHSTNS